MNIDDLTIGQVKELAALFGGDTMNIDGLIVGVAKAKELLSIGNVTAKQVIDHGLVIVVLDRGFVYIGYTATDGEWVYIERAKNIRYWGTTNGLGELVSGPTPNTKLDSVGKITAPFHALQQLIDVNVEKWEEVEKWKKEF